MNGGLGPWIPQKKIFMGIHAVIKTARRKVAITKELIKAKVHSRGWKARGATGPGPSLGTLSELGLDICCVSLAKRSCDIQWGGL